MKSLKGASGFLLFLLSGFAITVLMSGTHKDNQTVRPKNAASFHDPDSLFIYFKEPPHEYSLLPFWSWNNTLEPEKLNWQMDQMLDKGVYGAFMHAREGLDSSETPYFSKGWWDAVESTVKHAHEKGFYTCLYDEDKWPSGSAGGRTLAGNPAEYIKKALFYDKEVINGPQTIRLDFPEHPMAIYSGRISTRGQYDFSSQQNLTGLSGKEWKVPSGRWAIIRFTMKQDPGKQIDYLDSNAVARFLHVTHDEYFKRLAPYFGNTIPGVFFDEIYANLQNRLDNIFWTDDFLEQFKKIKGYDLKERLPLIIYDDPKYSSAARYDFFDVVRILYSKAWFQQYAHWANEHHIWVTGHTTEEMVNYIRQSDYFFTMGQLQRPCTDNEDFRYGYPRQIDWYNPKQMSSVGHIYGSERVAAEAMGGGGYTIPLEEYRNGFAMLGVYGINMFVPHLFHYSMDRPENQADWPPSWFYQNPYWKYFKPLADYARRISYMISQGNHVCRVALVYPRTGLWLSGYSFSADDAYYKEVQRQLLDHHIDYDVVDPYSLSKATSDSTGMKIGDERYKVLILPGMEAVQSDVMKKIDDFVGNGGILIGLKDLPMASEKGTPADPYVTQSLTRIFGFEPDALRQHEYYTLDPKGTEKYLLHENKAGGKGIFTRYVEELPSIIHCQIGADVSVEGKGNSWLKIQHRRVGNKEIYFFVNARNETCSYRVSLQQTGRPFLGDPETGAITEISNYRLRKGCLEIMLDLKPREASFVILEPGSVNGNDVLINHSDLKDFSVTKENDSVLIRGWASGNGTHNLSFWKGDDLIEKKWMGKTTLPEIPVTGNWDFQLSPHRLDYQWTSTLTSDTVELPVMQFRLQTGLSGNLEAAPVPSVADDREWKIIKVEDSFSKKRGCQRYLSSWNAGWINYYDYSSHLPAISGGVKYFRKEFVTGGQSAEASLDITADKSYTLYVNGAEAGKDSNWKRVTHYDIGKMIVPGKNIILIKTTDTRGLLLEGDCKLKDGSRIPIRSGDDWQASNDRVSWSPAFLYAEPPLGHWGNIERPGHSVHFPCTVWYRQVLPPGTEELLKPEIQGEYQLFVNGHPVHFGSESQADIRHLLNGNQNLLTIKVKIGEGSQGLQHPVKLICGKIKMPLQSWSSMNLSWYSGRGLYHHMIQIPEEYIQRGSKLILDAGQINYFAEIWVNDRLVTYRPWAPFRADITRFVHPGQNKISIVVANLLANKATWNIMDANTDNRDARWWHYGSIRREKEKLVSGLLGPVRIIPFIRDSFQLGVRDVRITKNRASN